MVMNLQTHNSPPASTACFVALFNPPTVELVLALLAKSKSSFQDFHLKLCRRFAIGPFPPSRRLSFDLSECRALRSERAASRRGSCHDRRR